jgi:hypothetical protein
MDLYRNFACHLDALGLATQHIVYALDDLTFDTLAAEGAPVVRASAVIPMLASATAAPKDQEYIHGTPLFARLTYRKLHVLAHAARALQARGFLYTDVDVVFLRNPLTHLDTTLDLQFASDYRVAPAAEFAPKEDDCGGGNGAGYICTGVFFGRGKIAFDVLRAAIAFGDRPVNVGRDDQLAVNAVLRDPGLLPRRARIGTFDGLSFANGYTFFHRHVPQRLSIDPVAVHANYILGKQSKRQHMMLHGLWKWMPKSRKCHGRDTSSKLSKLSPLPPRLNTQMVAADTWGVDIPTPTRSRDILDREETWIIVTCAEDATMLANFHAHVIKQVHVAAAAAFALPVIRLCSFQVSENDGSEDHQMRLSQEHSIRCDDDGTPSWASLATKRLNTDDAWWRAARGKDVACRRLQVLALDALFADAAAAAAVDGVLWADASTVFVRHPLFPVVQHLHRQHLDVAVGSGWEPRSVLGSLPRQSPSNHTISQSLREATSVAQTLRKHELPSPRTDATGILYMKINGKTRAIFVRARPHLTNILSVDAILDVELGAGDCASAADAMPPGANAFRPVVPCRATHTPARISWGMLDPLLFVDARHLQLAKDVAAPIHAVRFWRTPMRAGRLNTWLSQTAHMLVANLWRPTSEKEDWARQWHLFEESAALFLRGKGGAGRARVAEGRGKLHDEEDRVLREQLQKSVKWNAFHHACVVSKRLRSAAVPLLMLLEQASRVRHRTVHFMGHVPPKQHECKDTGRALIRSRSRCVITRRFLANRVADHQFMFHGADNGAGAGASTRVEAGAATTKSAGLVRLLGETALLYPFIKCEITIVVREDTDSDGTHHIVRKALESGLAAADGEIIAVEIASPGVR